MASTIYILQWYTLIVIKLNKCIKYVHVLHTDIFYFLQFDKKMGTSWPKWEGTDLGTSWLRNHHEAMDDILQRKYEAKKSSVPTK